MPNTKVRVERRKYKRFRVQDGAFVILSPSDNGTCRLINIGMGGLMFEYISMKAPPIKATKLDIFVRDSVFDLHNVPCEVIWDLSIYEHLAIPVHKRLCGVQFGELTPDQICLLGYFILNHTVGWAPNKYVFNRREAITCPLS